MERPDDDRRSRPPSHATWVAVTLLLVAGAIAMAIKWSQDSARSAAMAALRNMGVVHSVQGGVGGAPSSHRFRATEPAMSDAELSALVEHVAALARPHDLGLSRGEEIALIDLTATTTSPEALAKLREAFPNAEIRH